MSGAHTLIKVHLVWPIYDEEERAREIERLQLQAWGAAHAGCYGPVCRSRTESRCQGDRHVSNEEART